MKWGQRTGSLCLDHVLGLGDLGLLGLRDELGFSLVEGGKVISLVLDEGLC